MTNQELKEKLYRKIDEKTPKMIKMRRYLHQHPELSFHEKNTSKFIADFYKGMDVKVETNYGDGYGVVVTIDSGKPGKTIALRADFDALPVEEATNLPFKSVNKGVMHACGHDGHTAYMLTLAAALYELRNEWSGVVKIIHQPAEEIPPGGAKGMVKAGVLKGVDYILGAHGMAPLKFGTIGCTTGPVMTGRQSFKMDIHGKGGHGSEPQMANDANVAASFFVVAAQTIVSRRTDPFHRTSLTIGDYEGKSSFNVIKETVHLEGELRFLNKADQPIMEKYFKKLVAGLETMFDVKVDLDYITDYPVLNNDEKLTKKVQKSLENSGIKALKKVDTTYRNSASEDFAYFSNEIPGTFIFYGEMPDDGVWYPQHSNKFLLNEKALPLAAKAVGAATLDLLSEKD